MADNDVPPEVPDAKPDDREVISYRNNPGFFRRHYAMRVQDWWQTRSALIDDDSPAWRDHRGPEHALGHTLNMCLTAAEALRFLAPQCRSEAEAEMMLWTAGILKDLYSRRLPDVLTEKSIDFKTGKPKRGAREVRETLLTNLAPADAFALLVEKGYIPGSQREAIGTVCRLYNIESHVFRYQRAKTRPHSEVDFLQHEIGRAAPEDRWHKAVQYPRPYAARYRASHLPSESKRWGKRKKAD